ncbi:hypothetical protein OH76DRAFT_1481628 [Lentinus brumalis]|uniref:Uncharacterized protein n=1 Tax=Lentinus brumalis TaxID=2498619 RepID=A0A371DFS3_9APHY|nr:hypothetical protein OH76DRAFT_1481628 [Polyporus brumalis]
MSFHSVPSTVVFEHAGSVRAPDPDSDDTRFYLFHLTLIRRGDRLRLGVQWSSLSLRHADAPALMPASRSWVEQAGIVLLVPENAYVSPLILLIDAIGSVEFTHPLAMTVAFYQRSTEHGSQTDIIIHSQWLASREFAFGRPVPCPDLLIGNQGDMHADDQL